MEDTTIRREREPWDARRFPNSYVAASKLKRWAVTGSFAASSIVSVAAPEVAVVYADDPERVADTLRLRQVRNGGNVVIARPYDQVVFERTTISDNITYVSTTQAAIDCLTGPGRMPAQGEALVDWMTGKERRWQSNSLTGETVAGFTPFRHP